MSILIHITNRKTVVSHSTWANDTCQMDIKLAVVGANASILSAITNVAIDSTEMKAVRLGLSFSI